MFKNLFSKPLEAAKGKVSEYVSLKMEEVKLTTIEKAAPIAASILIIVLIIALSLISFVFLGMALAGWLASLMDSTTLGYLMTACIFIVLLILLAVSFKYLVRVIATKVAKSLADL